MSVLRNSRFPAVALLAAAALLGAVAGRSQTAASGGRATELNRVVLYAAVGPELTQYDVDVDAATLTRRGSITLPANVQEGTWDPSKRFLYLVWSDGGPSNLPPGSAAPSGTHHGLSAFRVDPLTGALSPNGPPAALPSRPIHVTMDIPGTHILIAYNDPSGITVHRIAGDGTIGSRVMPAAPLDVGIYGHQVRVDPSNQTVILVTRGNGPTAAKPEDPGALKIFSYKDGLLADRLSIAPNGGFNFQSRHLDFHPSRPWVFLSLERQDKLVVFRRHAGGMLDPAPLFVKDTLADPANVHDGQQLGTVHVHPNGKFVYLANRASGTEDYQGQPVFSGGENSIAVFAINQETGEPALLQNTDTRGIHTRTFAIGPGGKILVAANMMQMAVREAKGVREVPASLAVFRIGPDGRLDFVRKYDVAVGARNMFWMGMSSLP